jgi:dephospho-CoA kinase
MKGKITWGELVRKAERLLRLRSFPVAIKWLEDPYELDEIPFLRRPNKRLTLCQMINLVRNFDWTIGATKEDILFDQCSSIVGLSELPEYYRDGTFRSIVWVKSREDAKRYQASIPTIPTRRFHAIAMAPLVYNPYDPDIILIYANPAQMMLLINSLQFEEYHVMEFYCVGESSCSDAIARCFLTNRPSLTIPCYGERRYGHTQDDELVIALRPDDLPKAVRGLEGLYRRGIRYPISYAGAEMDLSSAFPPSYRNMDRVQEIRGRDGRLVVGLTGGIASGKSTVCDIFRDLGAHIVDFDLLARSVVEPQKPAWKDIVAYFGEQVLRDDKSIDRKKLSDIVFRDIEKRKKLESFTHPRIHEEFLKHLREITSKHTRPIIIVDVPLLIEQNLQYLFHKNILVYIPSDLQIRRLMERDGIDKEQAERIINAQLPMDEKKGYVDYLIQNDGSIESTRTQVEKIWMELRSMQES